MISIIRAPEPVKRLSKSLHVTLWAVQVVLALFFGMAGVLKTTMPLAELAKRMAWIRDVPGPLVRFIGTSEIAGALGMLLPSLTRIRPALTPAAAAGLTTIMILAAALHATRGELPFVAETLVVGALAAFVAWGRLRRAPILPRDRQRSHGAEGRLSVSSS